ncbi:oligosaccharide flippase family protein [Roseburia hominis]
MKSNKQLLVKNTIMLYLLRFSTYFFSFITVPYQTRIMGKEIYGRIGIATAMMMYFQLFLDFGFLLSGTEEVAKNKNDKVKLCEVFTSIVVLKIIFSIISGIVLVGICKFVPQYNSDKELYFLFLAQAVISCFLPDYLYRGLEDMSMVTYRTVFVKGLFTVLILVFLKQPSDYLCVPVISALGEFCAVVWSWVDLYKRYQIGFVPVKYEQLLRQIKKSSHFFLSRIASTVYTATNTMILGYIDPVSGTVGLYTAANKLITTGQSALAPISDSMYPYMIKNKDFKLAKKVLMVMMPVILVGTAIIMIWAEPFCVLIYGKKFSGMGMILRAMMPIAVLTLPDYILGFPTLGAMGLSKHANISIYVSASIHLINLCLVTYAGKLNAVTLAVLTSITVLIEVLYRLIVVIKNRKLMQGDGRGEKE